MDSISHFHTWIQYHISTHGFNITFPHIDSISHFQRNALNEQVCILSFTMTDVVEQLWQVIAAAKS